MSLLCESVVLEQHTLVVRNNTWLVEWTVRLSCCCSYLPVVVLLLDSDYSIFSKLSLEEGSGLCELHSKHGHIGNV